MPRQIPETGPSLATQVLERVRSSTHGRIRDLTVEEVQGSLVMRGNVPSHHLRQLALYAALELVASDRVRPLITVG